MAPVLALLLFGAPAAAFWLLVGGLDPIGRLVMAGLASMVIVSGIGGLMLITGLWYPLGGFAVVLALSALMAVLGHLQNRRRRTPVQPPVTQTRRDGLPLPGAPAKPAPAPNDDAAEDWLYES